MVTNTAKSNITYTEIKTKLNLDNTEINEKNCWLSQQQQQQSNNHPYE